MVVCDGCDNVAYAGGQTEARAGLAKDESGSELTVVRSSLLSGGAAPVLDRR